MRSRLIFLFALLVMSAIILTACGSDADVPTAEMEEPGAPSEGEVLPYPYPSSNEVYIPVTGSEPAYPAPDNDKMVVVDPYPGVVDPYPGAREAEIDVNAERVLDFSELAPASGDKKLTRGMVFVEWSELLIKESDPPQVELVIAGNLPTPCHKLRVVVAEPNTEGQLNIDAYTVVNPDDMCIQVLEPFQASIPLSDLPTGQYAVSINGEQAGEVEIP